MRQGQLVRAIAARIPPELRDMRGRMMLEAQQEFLGVDEAACPACAGTGWLSRRRLERCPVCCGFHEVPAGLADWYRAQTAVCHDDTTSTTDGDERLQAVGDDMAELAVLGPLP